MENYDSTNLMSNPSAPSSSDDSIFFNLILGTNYENTKENCLQFIINLSRHIYFSKRELFKILVNELTLNEYQNKVIGNDESIYLIRQLIKKYSRNNILNALYDYISEKDSNTGSNDVDNNLINSKDGSSMNKNSIPPEKDPALNTEKKNPIFEKDNEGEENELNNNEENQKKDFLSKKRKIPSKISNKGPIKEKEKEKKDKKRKKGKKANKEKNKEEKEKKNPNIKKDNDVIGKNLKDEENNNDFEDENMKEEDEEDIKKENEEEIGKKKKLKKDKNQENEKNKEEIKAEIKGEIKEEINKKGLKEEGDEIKKENINYIFKNEYSKEKNEGRKNNFNKKRILKSVPLCRSKGYTYFISRSDKKYNQTKVKSKRFFALEEIIKLESSDELNSNNSMTLSPIKTENSLNKNENKHLDISPYLNLEKSQLNDSVSSKQNENIEFRSHLIKYKKEKNMIFSYKLKKYFGENKKMVLFECNNKKCKGKGEYNIDKKIFTETFEHTICANSHKMASIYIVSRDILLNDDDCNGYQLLKNNTFIKDNEVIFLKES